MGGDVPLVGEGSETFPIGGAGEMMGGRGSPAGLSLLDGICGSGGMAGNKLGLLNQVSQMRPLITVWLTQRAVSVAQNSPSITRLQEKLGQAQVTGQTGGC